MDPEIMRRVALHDPNNEHSVPYLWGTTGIGYNEAKIKKILGDAPLDRWNYHLRPEARREIQGLRHLGARCAG